MKPYLLAFGLALTGQARAEEPKECIDEVVLQMEARPSMQDTAPLFLSEEVLSGVQQLYGAFGVLLRTGDSCAEDKKCLKINVTYGTPEDMVKDWFPNLNAYNKLVRNNGFPEQQLNQEKYQKFITKGVYNLGGIASYPSGRVYIIGWSWFGTYNYEVIRATKRAMENLVVHETGHIFGLGHAEDELMRDGRVNIMYGSGVEPSTYCDFSEADKQKIQQQVCKSEEQ